MEKTNFNAGWEISDYLSFDRLTGDARKVVINPPEKVHLPHDYMILKERDENAPGGWGLGYYPVSSKKYDKKFQTPGEWEGKRVIIEFEGAYSNAVVTLNGNYIGKHPYGYSNFFLDATKYIKYGQENRLTVLIKNGSGRNARCYSGEGLYRNVNLYISDMLHIMPEGVKIMTPEADSDIADVVIATEVESFKEGYRKIRVVSKIFDIYGNSVGENSSPAKIECGEKLTLRHHVYIKNAKLWSIEEPNLYYCESKLFDGETLIDKVKNHFGIRKVQFDPKYGLRLNGKKIEIRGGCFHHDNGVIGACAFARAEERKIELLKTAGFNALRSSHNPASKALLDAADRIGMLIMDESFDMWNRGKMENDHSNYFEEWWERDLKAMVDKDFNHPSVILYSIGNEIPERDGTSDGGRWSRRQAEFIRAIDPTRPITSGICGITSEGGDISELLLWMMSMNSEELANIMASSSKQDFGSLSEDYAASLDVVGYNYMHNYFEDDTKRFPNRIIVGTESGVKNIGAIWKEVKKHPSVIGDFAWTGMDYIGECGIGKIDYDHLPAAFFGTYPWILGYCGDIDLIGNRRPQSYYREIVWGLRTDPYIAVERPERYGQKPDVTDWSWHDVISSWSFPGFEGRPVKVEVYCNAEEVELCLNDKIIGKAPAGEASDYIAAFELAYEPGELKALAYTDGKEIGRSILKTVGKPAGIAMKADRSVIAAGAEDLSYIDISFIDDMGNVVPYMNEKIKVTVEGEGTLQGCGSADPTTHENFFDNVTTTYDGKMLAVIRSAEQAGKIKVTASAKGFPASALEIISE